MESVAEAKIVGERVHLDVTEEQYLWLKTIVQRYEANRIKAAEKQKKKRAKEREENGKRKYSSRNSRAKLVLPELVEAS